MNSNVSILCKAYQCFSFSGDSLIALVALLVAAFLRIYFPGPLADGIFCVAVLFLGFYLFRGQIPATVKFILSCFIALLAVYAASLVINFSVEGMQNLFGILFACLIFLFSYQNALSLTQARTLSVLLVVTLILFPIYLVPSGVNPNIFSGILGYLLLTIGLILITRSDSRKNQHLWAHAIFLLVAVIGVVFGHRSLSFVALLAYPLYWGSFLFLRNRRGIGVLMTATGLLLCGLIVFVGTSYFKDALSHLDQIAKKYTGGGAKSGREIFWKVALSSIAENPWLGKGPGAFIGSSENLIDAPLFCLTEESARLFDDCVVLMRARTVLTRSPSHLWNWRFEKPISSWQGVTVGGSPPRVVSLDLEKIGLNGRIPKELSKLDRLVALNLGHNLLTGSIPPELGKLSNLRKLSLNYNDLSGPIPEELGVLDLSGLYLHHNQLTGNVPEALGEIDRHDFYGDSLCLSQSLDNYSGLLDDCIILLDVRDELSGTGVLNWGDSIPVTSWQGVEVSGDPPRVTALKLSGMGLDGRIPPELGKLSKLHTLSLHHNQLVGPIPVELAKLKGLAQLRLKHNRLSGRIPPDLGGLSSLSVLYLSGNAFRGCPPLMPYTVDRHDLDSLCVPFSLDNPGLGADASVLLSIQDELSGTGVLNWDESVPVTSWQGVRLRGTPPRVTALKLSGMGLNGRIPKELSKLGRLVALHLDHNRLTGSVPAELGRLGRLQKLTLRHNWLTGPLPPGLRKVDHDIQFCRPSSWVGVELLADCIILLDVRDELSGTGVLNWDDSIPVTSWQGVEVSGDPPRVTGLKLSGMGLDGRIPPELGELSSLSILRFSGNAFRGCPSRKLYEVGDHDFSGDLLCLPVMRESHPGLFADASVLLDVRDELSGTGVLNWDESVPVTFWQGVKVSGDPPRVTGLKLLGMNLDGWIPPDLGGLSSLSVLYLSGNAFRGCPPLMPYTVDRHDLDSLCVPFSLDNPGLGADASVLLSIQDELSGTGVLNWDESVPVTSWQGVRLRGTPPRVTALKLSGMGLNGRIPKELSKLGRLVALHLDHNRLTGSVPAELGRLGRLQKLTLRHNWLTGPLPPGLRKVDHDIQFCRPSSWVGVELLADCIILLDVRDELSGTGVLNWDDSIPVTSWQGVEVSGDPPRVTGLKLSGMGLDGRIPPELGELSSLSILRFSGNAFRGCPSRKLYEVGDHDFSGDLLCLPVMRESHPGLFADASVLLDVRDELSGTGVLNWDESVPVTFWQGVKVSGDPPRITALELPNMGLNGRIPAELGALRPLRELDLRGNRLSGPIPSELEELYLSVLRVRGNKFEDCLPSGLYEVDIHDLGIDMLCYSELVHFPSLFVDANVLLSIRDELSGTGVLNWDEFVPVTSWQGVKIGRGVHGGTRVIGLDLTEMGLNGFIPPELSALDQLVALYLDGNQLTGAVPPELGELRMLNELGLEGNSIDDVPRGVRNLPSLWVFREVDGTVRERLAPAGGGTDDTVEGKPDGDVYCRSLYSEGGLFNDCSVLLSIRDELSGTGVLNWDESVPVTFWQGVKVSGDPPRITALELPNMGLNGRIPAELGALRSLRELDLRGNRLSGPIPSELEELYLSVLRVRGNKFEDCLPSGLYEVDIHDLGIDMLCYSELVHFPSLFVDANVLLSIRDELSGTGVLNWDEFVPVTSWQGVKIGRGVHGGTRVIGLDLTEMGLNGFIPPELSALDQLVALYLDGNQLTGAVPPELGELRMLNELGLEGNSIDDVPRGVRNLPSLWVFREVDGTVRERLAPAGGGTDDTVEGKPDGDVYCRSLYSEGGLFNDCSVLLSIRDELSGTGVLNWDESVPVTFWQGVKVSGDPPRITALELPNMGLNGRIPAALGELSQLVVLNLNRNRLKGAIPEEIIEIKSLGILRLADNQLRGSIPQELIKKRDLHDLNIEGNDFQGCLNPKMEQYEVSPHYFFKAGLAPCNRSRTQQSRVGRLITEVNTFVNPSIPEGFYVSSHNLFLETGVQTGVIGIIVLCLLCASLISNLRSRAAGKIEPSQSYVAACTVLIIIHSSFEIFLFRINMGVIAWVLIGIGAWVAHHSRHSRAQDITDTGDRVS